MIFRFREDEAVLLVDDEAFEDVRAGTVGMICTLYRLDEPAYEVLFRLPDGEEFSSVLFERQLDPVSSVHTDVAGRRPSAAAPR